MKHSPKVRTIQPHALAHHTCRTPACGISSHGQSSGGGHSNQNLNQGRNRATSITNNRLRAPKVLQSKTHTPHHSEQSTQTSVAPPAYRPQPVLKVMQTKSAQAKTSDQRQQRTSALRTPTVKGRAPISEKTAVVQPLAAGVVQAVKIYPNLHPGATEPIDRGNVFRLNSFANQYRLHRVNSHSVNVPNQQYNFVRTREGEMLLHARYRHPSIAEGKQVLYAGEIFFNNGQLEWWSNGSGHYQPYAEDAGQANLPMDQFFSYQQIIKGEHKRKRG